ncbi:MULTISPECIES: methylenetetrahydrofolate reductase [NAD(P)H] [Pandoraea]|uniref:Methylenetetrahydrofolate reductase n=2 Tax=Pandoraea TaxID=93217 RepID=A0A378YPV7_9BURK|nr:MULTISPECIES: methylenetetrahydrofolate reductase [NAD(P)H] [Pandoraea]AHB07757.1 5,10-methylenetetrahydrofolate reductase [Pandoraea pnomenusa 3kgm]AHB76048.1 methylenetetrahydrofolate reductase [NAD(P)H] [Pandoraea pnomenusa]AHN75625.1 methylenetetrahydrofolate reductase [NAD(P)H] [Pandoraea pnomenusa]AIU27793.1 5,10-methylenetetrahydrofolate reductase [Pandoraea pnomenusa]ANC44928.1 methylenetetrahydrofolate reductase [NAD(P)H] [Pandoraea pnomenusa]
MTQPSFSFEFFPPKTADGAEKLRATRQQLFPLGPKFVSVTFGAGGSTQQGTLDTVVEIQREGVEAAPHLSCVGSTRENIREILQTYRQHGIRHIVALRGDLPSGMGEIGEFRYASELVEFIRAETGDWFHVEVAAYPEYHPQARSPRLDLEHFANKVKAGANAAITQYFFNADAYFRFVDDVARLGVQVPIVPGIMPITNYSQMMRFSEMCGAEVPRWIAKRLEGFGDDREAIRAFGLDVVTGLCERLLAGGAPGLHFYTLNAASATKAMWQRLGL